MEVLQTICSCDEVMGLFESDNLEINIKWYLNLERDIVGKKKIYS